MRGHLGGPPGPLRMADVSGVIGEVRAVELAMFIWLGRLSGELEDPKLAVWASSASRRAAWRAGQLETLLPVSVGLVPERDGGSELSPADLASRLAAEGRATGPGDLCESPAETATRWYSVLLRAYDARLGTAQTASDGPLERVLRRVVDDLRDELRLVGQWPGGEP